MTPRQPRWPSVLPAMLAALVLAACASQGVERQATQTPLPAEANGIWYSAAVDAVFYTDDSGNRIQSRTNDGRVSTAATLSPAPASGAGLGQVVRDADGRFIVTRFGFGKDGGVAWAAPGQGTVAAGEVSGLAPARRRIGVWPVSSNTYVVSWFERREDGTQGPGPAGVSLLTLDRSASPVRGTERELVTGLVKPVGVAVRGNVLYIGDQSVRKIYVADLEQVARVPVAASTLKVLAQTDSDQFALAPNGDLFTGGREGVIRRIASDGTVSVVAEGFQSIRGVAFDAGRRQLYAIEHGKGASTLRRLPVE